MLNLLIDTILGWLINFVQDLFEALFSSNLATILSNIAAPQELAKSLPYIDVLFNAMDVIAWVFLVICAYSVIIKAVVSQFGGEGSTENPIKSVIKIFIAAALISLRPQMMLLVANIFSRLYGLMPNGLMAINNLTWWSNANPVKIFTRVVLICMVAFGAVGAALAYLERIYSFLIFMYTYPIAIAFSVNKETSDMFRQWIIGVISQMIMIVLSSGMLYMAVNLLNIATNETFMESVSFFQDSVNIFAFFLAINAMSLVKNSEKILNMYNIRTMPNQDTVSSFSGAFHKALAIGTGAAALTFNSVNDIGHVMFGAPAAPSAGSGGPSPVTPSGSSEQILPKDGANFRTGAWETTKETINLQGQDFATKAAKPTGPAGINSESSVTEKLSLEKAEAPSTNQKMTEAYSRKIMDDGYKAKTMAGSAVQKVEGVQKYNEFSSSVDTAIKEINESRDKVNGWLQDNSESKSDTHLDGIDVDAGKEALNAMDAYKGYGMANDKTLRSFKPEGFTVPVYKNGKLDGFMMKGKQTDERTGNIREKQIYVSSDAVQKSDGTIGKEKEWTIDKSGFHQVTPNAFVYDVKPSKKFENTSKDQLETQKELRDRAVQLMDTGSYKPNIPLDNNPTEKEFSGKEPSKEGAKPPEQPDPVKLQSKFEKADPGKYEGESRKSSRKNTKKRNLANKKNEDGEKQGKR